VFLICSVFISIDYSEKDKRLIQEGEAKGVATGEAKAAKRMARQMKMDGQPSAIISKYTGLTTQEIEKL